MLQETMTWSFIHETILLSIIHIPGLAQDPHNAHLHESQYCSQGIFGLEVSMIDQRKINNNSLAECCDRIIHKMLREHKW